ncbi:MAG TPA: peroxiredoxin [Thermoplasmata archaeon]|nr:peroxiredoxin [Thermoplasmata archaeon]
MIQVGDLAPNFRGTAGDGTPFELASRRGKPVILYFYPKAHTTGCSLETRGFAQQYPELQKAGIDVIGVSVDSVEDQKSFAAECGAAFPLISDRDKSIARSYGVLGLLGMARRVTFFVGPDGRVQEVVEGLRPGPHVERALARARSAAPPPT